MRDFAVELCHSLRINGLSEFVSSGETIQHVINLFSCYFTLCFCRFLLLYFAWPVVNAPAIFVL